MPFDEFHVDDDVLALLALGEEAGTTADRAHVQECELCGDEIAALADVVGLARSADTELVTPGPQVWERIAAELELAPAAVPATAPDPVVVPLAPRRRPRAWAWISAAAAVGIIIGGAGVGWALTRDDRARSVVATATLDPLPGWSAQGSAKVETTRDGTRVLVVDVDEKSDPDGFREVWLLTPDVKGLVSVGTLDGSSGRFDLPAGLDLDEYSVVDVSQEPFDGNPAHSGDSIVRGALRA
ncbi:anti-sigma-K factor rskA [Cellulomonas sp. PhB150]|nr:anti-sigma-K factor rskA [Cellulomonas sp. PhB150]